MNIKLKTKLFTRTRWLILFLIIGSASCMWAYKTGVKEGRIELIHQVNQPELSITHFSRDVIHLVMIQQRMPKGDQQEHKVTIDVSSVEGLEAELLGYSGSGKYNYWEVVSLWKISNSSDKNLALTEKEFTNLPDSYQLPKNFDGEFSIPPNPES